MLQKSYYNLLPQLPFDITWMALNKSWQTLLKDKEQSCLTPTFEILNNFFLDYTLDLFNSRKTTGLYNGTRRDPSTFRAELAMCEMNEILIGNDAHKVLIELNALEVNENPNIMLNPFKVCMEWYKKQNIEMGIVPIDLPTPDVDEVNDVASNIDDGIGLSSLHSSILLSGRCNESYIKALDLWFPNIVLKDAQSFPNVEDQIIIKEFNNNIYFIRFLYRMLSQLKRDVELRCFNTDEAVALNFEAALFNDDGSITGLAHSMLQIYKHNSSLCKDYSQLTVANLMDGVLIPLKLLFGISNMDVGDVFDNAPGMLCDSFRTILDSLKKGKCDDKFKKAISALHTNVKWGFLREIWIECVCFSICCCLFLHSLIIF